MIRGNDEIDSIALNVDYIACQDDGACKNLSKSDLHEYLNYPELVIIYNTQRFDNKIFNEDCVVNESKIWN